MVQAALHASRQAEAKLDSELQKCRDAISRHDTAAAAVAASLRVELETLQQQLSDRQRHAEGLQVREEEARSQAKQLATALTAAQVDYQVPTQHAFCSHTGWCVPSHPATGCKGQHWSAFEAPTLVCAKS